jgi:hypothetical protein
VDGVGQQGHGAGQGDDGHLEQGGDPETAEADDQSSHARLVGGDGVDALGGVVAVRREQVADRSERTLAVVVSVTVMVVDVVARDIIAVAVMVRVTAAVTVAERVGVALVVTVAMPVARVGGGHALWASAWSWRRRAAATKPSTWWSWAA